MIIGVTGTLGSGKGTVVERLVSAHGFTHMSVRVFLIEEINRRGLLVNRDSMHLVANSLRTTHGSGYIIEQLVARAQRELGNAVIESIHAIGEAEYLHSCGARLWAVDANVKTRYERIVARASETDAVSFEEFVSDEQREFHNSDPAKQNLAGVIALADLTIYNDGSREELFAKVDQALARG